MCNRIVLFYERNAFLLTYRYSAALLRRFFCAIFIKEKKSQKKVKKVLTKREWSGILIKLSVEMACTLKDK